MKYIIIAAVIFVLLILLILLIRWWRKPLKGDSNIYTVRVFDPDTDPFENRTEFYIRRK